MILYYMLNPTKILFVVRNNARNMLSIFRQNAKPRLKAICTPSWGLIVLRMIYLKLPSLLNWEYKP
eukprot:snap_masked-scaffold_111-processed-gene-0.0-mRNA-1 protein AED:1.00 eAED:1.00 QI:0/0/0/0/1/1/2/0/65